MKPLLFLPAVLSTAALSLDLPRRGRSTPERLGTYRNGPFDESAAETAVTTERGLLCGRRSARWLRPRSAPAAPAAQRHGSDRPFAGAERVEQVGQDRL